MDVLLIEDQPLDAELCERELKNAGLDFRSRRVCRKASLIAALTELVPDVILSDFSMPSELDGFSALEIAREHAPGVPFIFVSGTIGEERAVEALKAGATDYVLKDKLWRLGAVVKRALQEARHRRAIVRAQEALRLSEARFRSFMGHLPGNASICDADGRYAYVNEVWEKTFGLSADEVIGRRYDELPAQFTAELLSGHATVLRTNAAAAGITKTGSNGNSRWWLSHHFPIPALEDGRGMVGTIAIDVTERTLQEERIARLSRIHAVLSGLNSAIVRLRDSRQLLAEACCIANEHGGFGVAWIGMIDPASGHITAVASAGLGPEEDVATSALVINGAPRSRGIVAEMLGSGRPAVCNDITVALEMPSARRQEAVRRGYRSMLVLPLTVSGRIAAAFCLYSKERNAFSAEEVKLLIQLASDVSFGLELNDKEEKLYYLAWHDPVTGLANRARLHDRLQDALATAAPGRSHIAVVVWDIKRFRTINDTFGRSAGDELLRIVAAKIANAWPRVEHMARLSADCFGGLVSDVTRATDIAQWMEQSAAALAEPVLLNGTELLIGVTAGIAMYPTDGRDPDTLLANAEAALKQAKLRAERYVFYEAAMNARVAEKLTLESRLRRALDKDQFVLHYQKKIDVATGAAKGLEALIRWDDPEAGLVPPAKFIPLLEETGLILDVGRWAIGKALADRRARASQGLPTPRVAVNVSAIQLRRPEFVAGVLKSLGTGDHGLDLEITESLLMEDIEANIAKLRALKDEGINISIDDFGTGYSSLSYLAQLPVDALKIDRSFVMSMMDKSESTMIISTIISLAHALRMRVIAEGVETAEQAKLLRLLQCDEAQGYLFARPMPWDLCFDPPQ
ncbi:MAG TPA: EAL domain-containing protein [Burkholderiales bacterium]|nr:EAL domain-containing protein [Burkholderiales bacterium]